MLKAIVRRSFRRTERRAAGPTAITASLSRSRFVESVGRNPRFSPNLSARAFRVRTFQILHWMPRIDLSTPRIESKTLNTTDLEYWPLHLMAEAPIILAHNHPSGDSTPSQSDIKITGTVKRGGDLLGIPLVDHVIIGRASSPGAPYYSSMKELGYLD